MKKYATLFLSLYYGFRIFCLLLFPSLTLICFAHWELPLAIIILFCLLFSVIAALGDDRYFTAIPLKIKRFLYPLILAVMLLILLLRNYDGQFFFNYSQTVLDWLINNLNGNAPFSMEYSLFTLFCLFILLSLIIRFCEKYFKIQMILSLIIIICMLILGTTDSTISPLALFAGIFYSADTCITFCLRNLCKQKDVSVYGASLSMILVVMIGIVVIIPFSDEPIPYYQVGSAWDHFCYDISGLTQDILFNFTSHTTGIGGNSVELNGGEIKPDDTIVLDIYKTCANYNPIYLTSSIADYYSGTSWLSKLTPTEKDPEFSRNSDERINNLVAAGFSKTGASLHILTLRIRYQHIYTRNILYTTNCTTIMDFSPQNTVETKGLNVQFKKRPKLESNYIVSSTEINYQDDAIKEFLNSRSSFNELMKNDPAKAEEFSSYLQLPDSLPERVFTLAEELTADCSSDYEKAEMIRRYVNQFVYSTSVKNLPKGKDAVDYFLFEQQEGYCIHFASAMAVLCRSVNIPARYVQGMAIGEGKEAQRWFSIPAYDAHSWCEVYINGYGWVPMDATPVERFTSYHNWPEIKEPEPEPDYTDSPLPFFIPEEEPVDTTAIDLEAQKLKNAQRDILLTYAGLAIGILACVLLILLLIIFISRQHKKKLFLNSSFHDQAISCLQDILLHLSYLGIEKKDTETMLEFTDRLEYKEPNIYPDAIKALLLYNDKRYSQDGFVKSDIAVYQTVIEDLQNRYIQKHGKMQYFLKRNLHF